MSPKIIDITGNRYGMLLVVNFNRIEKHRSYWLCRCDCGATTIKRGELLKNGKTTSCGCLKAVLMSQKFKGKPLSKDHRKKLSDIKKSTVCKIAGWNKGVHRSKESTAKFSAKMKGRKRPPFPEEWRKNIGNAGLGRVRSLEVRMKMSQCNCGEKCHMWKGGVTPLHKKIRQSFEYKLWRSAVFERDNWTCKQCHKRGGYMEAHHIKEFHLYPELRFDINNGETLCKACHDLTKQGRRILPNGKVV